MDALENFAKQSIIVACERKIPWGPLRTHDGVDELLPKLFALVPVENTEQG